MSVDPILFLDFDGVLNSGDTGYGPLKERHVALLQEIYEATRCRVVVSSTWRLGTTAGKLGEMLRSLGYGGPVIDKTPELYFEGRQRGHEIRKWLDDNRELAEGAKIAILDDDSDMATVEHLHVKTSTRLGLTVYERDRAIELLLGRWPVAELAQLRGRLAQTQGWLLEAEQHAERLAEAVRVFSCEPQLGKLTRLRATAGYRAIREAREAWRDWRARVVEEIAREAGGRG